MSEGVYKITLTIIDSFGRVLSYSHIVRTVEDLEHGLLLQTGTTGADGAPPEDITRMVRAEVQIERLK